MSRMARMSHQIFDIITLLEKRNVHFFTSWDGGSKSVTLFATLVGKRIEIYLDANGSVDFSVFRGNEDVIVSKAALIAELDSD